MPTGSSSSDCSGSVRPHPDTAADYGRDSLSGPQTVAIAGIEAGVPALVEAREIVAAFHVVIRKRACGSLDLWIARARNSLVSSFANGIGKDRGAVLSAINSPWSSGQVEGQITRLKLVKRQMYGRAKLDLLEARLVSTRDQRQQKCVKAISTPFDILPASYLPPPARAAP